VIILEQVDRTGTRSGVTLRSCTAQKSIALRSEPDTVPACCWAVARSTSGRSACRHARGLTIQLSQGQVASPSCRGGASGSGRAALTSCSSIGVRRRHDTPSWCGCQPYFAFSPRTRRMLCGMRAASHSILEDLRCRVRSWGTWTSPAHALYEMQAQSLHSMRPRAGCVETPSAQSLHCPRCAVASMHTEARRKVCCHSSHHTCPYTSQCHAIACPCRASTTAHRGRTGWERMRLPAATLSIARCRHSTTDS
jgi:hypothetical protein